MSEVILLGMVDYYDTYLEEGQNEYFKDEARNKIKFFIKEMGYAYVVDDILREYQKYKNGHHVNYTIKKCIDALENEVLYLLNN